MSDKPIVGDHRDVSEETPVDGVVLYNPYPKPPPPSEEAPPPEEPKRGWVRVLIGATVLLALGGGYLATVGLPGGTTADQELPPMIPSMLGGGAAALTIVGDTEPTAPAGREIGFGVRATGPGGVALADTLIRFRVDSGDGALAQETASTDEQGVARATLLLPPRPGPTVVVAEVVGAQIAPVRIQLAAVPGPPGEIALVAGNDQVAEVGELLSERVALRVVDALGNPIPGIPVSFRVRTGSGMTAPSQARTDSAGLASALWRLGMEEGEQRLAATSPDLGSELVFTAQATPGPSRALARDLVPTGAETDPVSVRASTYVIGGSHVCELSAGQPVCRGGNDRGQSTARGSVPFVALATGISHLCGLDAEGAAYCWGANESGQVGDGATTDRSEPVPVRTELRFSSITAGAAHTCGLAGGGIPACWGHNLNGQLGDGSRNDQRGPRTVGGGLGFRTLTAGWNHTCGLTASGNAFCWGLNSQGQLGDGSRLDRLVPTLVRGAVETLVAGSSHTCGISEGRVLCWGGNAFGQLGDGTTEDRSQPTEVLGLPSPPVRVAAGAVHVCALVQDGAAYCWGQNLQGQLGDGTTENRPRATPVSGGLRYSEIYAGGAATCARTAAGNEYCWGLNSSGQLGDGTRVNRTTPVRVGG